MCFGGSVTRSAAVNHSELEANSQDVVIETNYLWITEKKIEIF